MMTELAKYILICQRPNRNHAHERCLVLQLILTGVHCLYLESANSMVAKGVGCWAGLISGLYLPIKLSLRLLQFSCKTVQPFFLSNIYRLLSFKYDKGATSPTINWF